jgi:hypothetical protein
MPTQIFKDIVQWDLGPVIQGTTTDNISFTLVDPAFPDGLNGANVVMTLTLPGTTIVEKTFDVGDGGIVINDADACVFSLAPYTCLLKPIDYLYDIKIVYPGDIIKKRFRGFYKVENDLTKCLT